MKNPFDGPASEKWFCSTWDLSAREFCAHALNWHDKLVADNKRLREALQRIGSGGYGPHACKAISTIVSAALLTEEDD